MKNYNFVFVVMLLALVVPVFAAGKKEKGEEKFKIEEVTFKAECDGTDQKYNLILPPRFQAGVKHDVLIALHGHGSDRMQFVKDVFPEARAARKTASEKSMIYVTPDYRGNTSWMGPKAEADVVQIIGELKKKYKTGRIFICGASMGGSSCLTFTALHPELIDGVASMNGTANHMEYDNFQSYIKESFGGSKTDIPEEYKKRSAELWPEKFKMPVGITVGGQDKIVPPQSVLRLGAKLKDANPDNVLVICREKTAHTTSEDDAITILNFIIKKAAK
ncbi:MAG: alpha/beta fold hydrolase [bacterium]